MDNIVGEVYLEGVIHLRSKTSARQVHLCQRTSSFAKTTEDKSSRQIIGVRNNADASGNDAVQQSSVKKIVPKTPEQFTYDNDGNVLSDGRFNYTWDGENRLVKVESILTACDVRVMMSFVPIGGVKISIARGRSTGEIVKKHANLRYVQSLLGHKSLATTERYLQLLINDLKEAHRKFHPRERTEMRC